MKWTPKDVVAVIVVVVAASLLHRGIDTVVGYTLLGVVAGYYGISLPALIKIYRNGVKEKKE